MKSVSEMSPEGQTAGVRREARRPWKISEMPPVNAQSLGLIELGFLRVDSTNRNQILSKIRSRSRPIGAFGTQIEASQISCQINQMSCQSINQIHRSIMAQVPMQIFQSKSSTLVLHQSTYHNTIQPNPIILF